MTSKRWPLNPLTAGFFTSKKMKTTITEAVMQYINKVRVATVAELAQATQKSTDQVRAALRALKDRGAVTVLETANGGPSIYGLHDGATKRALPIFAHESKSLSVTTPRTTKMAGIYKGTELQRNPGLTPDRFTAFALPSRIGNRLHYSCGKTELIT